MKDLYRTRNYELGLVELVELGGEYPNDEHILSMKGSLYEKLGSRKLARESWEEVLRHQPLQSRRWRRRCSASENERKGARSS